MLGCVRCTSRHWRVHVNSALASSLLLHVLWSRRINGTTINQQTSRLHSTVSNTPQCHKCLLWFTHTFHLFVCVMSDTSWQLLHYVSAEFAMSPVTSNHQKFEITVNFSSSFISSSAENIRWNIRWNQRQPQGMTTSMWNSWRTWAPKLAHGCPNFSPESWLHIPSQRSGERPRW